ncbi:hypothetical protein CONPUDRAFT_98596 [Coniophora puteana RWD-64-598 SS2]|uniref:Amidohydrolase-related domain-containing protein n=1 Tax=Coniophora puteana (strain RWD-64-598) TaxID=741705 RepID=A0A5M3N3U1_CONPW|nr:uncharacterized protein CONPUDRAFT_98596 [Coniophora puteana RWD-64-598 SS2]EIW85515.1 hypothetical protein CONPUDRAFT_98596 [Coniophora puteana RWD-64-598 SS2]
MVGDLYCLPASAYLPNLHLEGAPPTRAVPVTQGVPFDSEPHFSPDGRRLLFTSDAESGVDNIWITEWKGCEAMDLSVSSRANADLARVLETRDLDEDLLAQGVPETAERTHNRLLREGRLGAQRVTNETYRFVADARFHPSGDKIIATKRYFSERSLGAGEGWAYDLPGAQTQNNIIPVGAGTRVVGRTLPPGWSKEDYEGQQIGAEQFIWAGEDTLIYSKNVVDDGVFTYSKDVHSGIYAIFAKNLTSGETETLVGAFPGGASRPELSRDGRTLAFVRRVRDREALVLKDLHTGTLHHIWHGLTYDLSTIYAPMGTYPSFAFTPSSSAIILWAAGQIYNVPLSVNADGERVAATGASPAPIRFSATIRKRLAETRSGDTADLVRMETAETQRLHAFKELQADDGGRRVLFHAAGATYVQDVAAVSGEGSDAAPRRVPVLRPAQAYYAASFVPGAPDLVVHARWSDSAFSAIEIANVSGGALEIAGLPLGRYYAPVLCACAGATVRTVAFVKTGGDVLTGDVVATANTGLYLGEIALPRAISGDAETVELRNLRYVRTDIATEDPALRLRFIDANRTLLIQESDRAYVLDLASAPDAYTGKHAHETLATGKASDGLAVVPRKARRGGEGGYAARTAAFVDNYHVYVVDGRDFGRDEALWSRPGKATRGIARVSLDGGHDVAFSGDGRRLFWLLGPYLHSIDLSKLRHCTRAIKNDASTFGIACTREQLDVQELDVRFPTDIARLKRDARAASPENDDADVVVVRNATVLTMQHGARARDLVSGGVVVVRAGVIEAVGDAETTVVPPGATVIEADGGYVVPGFIDAHAHWSGTETHYPTTSWEMQTFLAYGVTTLHNPSLENVGGYVERGRIENGLMIGPRSFQVGNIIYGASNLHYHADIADMQEARSALIRIKAEGGPASFSYKNYNLPSRASRQRLLLQAKNLSMLCVPEGGMNYNWDLAYIIDGMTTVEHNIPIPELYEDVLTLYAMSGTAATPTHIVDYGGAWGEQLVYEYHDVPNDPKLREFTRHDILEGLSEVPNRPLNSYALFNVSKSITKMAERGLLANIGAHGEPPLGLNYHAEIFFAHVGGMSNYQVLQAATANAAKTFGLWNSIGSVHPGKLADLVIYPAGVDLLDDEKPNSIRNTQSMKYVMRGGRLWETDTMTEVWPVKGRKQVVAPINPA